MQLDSDDLLAQLREDWPEEYERSQLRLLVEKQHERITELEQGNADLREENDRCRVQITELTAVAQQPPYVGRYPTLDDPDGRHA